MLPKCCRVHARDHHPRFLPCDRSLLSLSFISAADAAADRPYPLSVSQGPALFPSSFFPFSHPLFRPLGKCIQHTHTCGVRASETRANAVSPHRASEGKTRKLCERHFESVWSSRGREGATDRSERLLPGWVGGRLFCRGHGWRGIRK